MNFFETVGAGLAGVFSGIYPDGTLHRTSETRASGGDVTETERFIPIKAKVDNATEAMKSDAGYSTTDVAVYVLRTDLSLSITTDDDVTANGVRYRIGGPIRLDTAGSHFILRGMIN